MEFCAEMMRRFDENNNFFIWIVFSDEANYMDLSIYTIADIGVTKIHWMRDSHTQYPQKLNIWAGILGNTYRIIFLE